MAFIPLNSSQIEAGKAVRKELWQVTKDNFDDLNSRTTAIENVTQKIVVFNGPVLNIGQYAGSTALEQIFFYRAPLNLNIVEFQLYQRNAGASGTLEADLKIGNDMSSLSSIMTVRPSILASAGDDVFSTNQLFATQAVSEGQFISLDFTLIQEGQGRVQVLILGEPS